MFFHKNDSSNHDASIFFQLGSDLIVFLPQNLEEGKKGTFIGVRCNTCVMCSIKQVRACPKLNNQKKNVHEQTW
jgi:hypothetical protein